MLKLVDDQTLFQIAVTRLEGVFAPENIFVVSVEDQAIALKAQCPEIPADNFLLEPLPRGTASVVGLAATALNDRDPNAVMAVLTADHIIANQVKFHQLLLSAYDVAQEGFLVTLGITPTSPATGYGYIHQGEMINTFNGLDVYKVLRFVEKPDEAKAREMLGSGDHSWNSGMFVWRIDSVMAEISRQMPDLDTKLKEISRAWGTPDQQEVLLDMWPSIQAQTIDYGIMEHALKVAVIPAVGLGWSDVGSWDALFDILPSQEDGNITRGGSHIQIDTRRSLVYTDQDDRLIVTIGLEDLVLVDTGDVLLVCQKEKAQQVRQVVEQLKQASILDFI
jgi:mannose-1-phosphate guanylyltransferase